MLRKILAMIIDIQAPDNRYCMLDLLPDGDGSGTWRI